MRPKGKSPTTSSRSTTIDSPLQTPVQFVKGVGPKLAAQLAAREIKTVRDLLFFFPRAYEDRSKVSSVGEMVVGEKCVVEIEILSARRIPLRRSGKTLFEVRGRDATGEVSLKWFNPFRSMESRFPVGEKIIVTGTPKKYMGRFEMIHPEVNTDSALSDTESNVGRVIPVYTEIDGIPTRTFRKVIFNALEKFGAELREELPLKLLEKNRFPSLADSVRFLHFPDEKFGVEALTEFKTPYHERMIYEEFFKLQFLVVRQKLRMEEDLAPRLEVNDQDVADLAAKLPFELTGAQKETIAEIVSDFRRAHPMNRLVQGDVGSGKTVVAFLTAGALMARGGQVALLAPTEILAEQHFNNLRKVYGREFASALLTGKTSSTDRAFTLARLAAGEPMLLIGTHALLEDPVVFRDLVYVIVDEQHRFGVDQKRKLRSKGVKGKIHPHQLVMSATPIPRTLALTAYGDLRVSNIRELPPGRKPVKTFVVDDRLRARAYQRIREEIGKGRQAYFICPLVNESEAERFSDLKSAVEEARRLQEEIFPQFKVGLMHGQLKADEKARIMREFSENKLQILVSTTVVEVGVDVPNATIIAVEHANRFGLSQLHQLRGRVGRGEHESFCFLLTTKAKSEVSQLRLDVLERTTDGFKIAEADLEIRGPGEFLGTRQSGSIPLKMANLVRDREILDRARADVVAMLRADPGLEDPGHLPVRKFLREHGKTQMERLKTS